MISARRPSPSSILTRPRLLAAGLAAWALSGCGDDPTAAEKFAEDYAALACPALAECCADTDLPKGFDCKGAIGSRPVSGYTKEKGVACLDAVRATPDPCARLSVSACSELFDSPESQGAQDGKAEGESCDFSSDCAAPAGGDSDCHPVEEGGQSVCVVLVRGSAGDACAESCVESGGGRSCSGPYPPPPGTHLAQCYRGDGLRCDDATLKCVALNPAGAECDSDGACADGLVCSYAAGATDADRPHCRAPGGVGDPCATPFGGADRSACADSYCDETEHTCKPLVAAGGACDPSAFAEVCGADAFCDGDTSTCVSNGGGGELLCGLLALASGGF